MIFTVLKNVQQILLGLSQDHHLRIHAIRFIIISSRGRTSLLFRDVSTSIDSSLLVLTKAESQVVMETEELHM